MNHARATVIIALVDKLPGSCRCAAVWRRPGMNPSEVILLSARMTDRAGAVLDTAILRMTRLRRLAGNEFRNEQFECVDDVTDLPASLEEPFLTATLKVHDEYLRVIRQIRRAPKKEVAGIGSARIGSISF